MTPSAILFGAIGTLAETSELQRRAYNMAFAAHDLEWVWDAQSYYRMLQHPGGRGRLADYAAAAGDEIDVAAVHASKEHAFEALAARGLDARPGVPDLLRACADLSVPTAFCTTTSVRQVNTILTGLGGQVSRDDFGWIGDRDAVANEKPAPDIYLAALDRIGADASGALVIEDTPEGAEAAIAGGLTVIGFPGRAAQGRSFPDGVAVVDRLDASLLSQGAAQPLAAE